MQRRRRGIAKLRLTPRSRSQLGGALLLCGLLLWAVALTLLHGLVARPLGVVVGGALAALGIILLAAFG